MGRSENEQKLFLQRDNIAGGGLYAVGISLRLRFVFIMIFVMFLTPCRAGMQVSVERDAKRQYPPNCWSRSEYLAKVVPIVHRTNGQ